MNYKEAIAWMRVHGQTIEEQARAGDAGGGDVLARAVSYRFTELLMDPDGARAQQRLIVAIVEYMMAHTETRP